MQVSVIITTYNEEQNISRCLEALQTFDEIIVVDSFSQDQTVSIAEKWGAKVILFQWNGCYPKKRQWCLDNIATYYNWILFIDADEVITPECVHEIMGLMPDKAGYFIKGRYVWDKKPLNHGVMNNKLALIDKTKMEFPLIQDLGEGCIGEMEGHYQPVLKNAFRNEKLGILHHCVWHYAYEDIVQWQLRHERYAIWEAKMIRSKIYPQEDDRVRHTMKIFFRVMPCRAVLMFLYGYCVRLGFLDGKNGLDFALSRYRYYRMVANALNANKDRA